MPAGKVCTLPGEESLKGLQADCKKEIEGNGYFHFAGSPVSELHNRTRPRRAPRYGLADCDCVELSMTPRLRARSAIWARTKGDIVLLT